MQKAPARKPMAGTFFILTFFNLVISFFIRIFAAQIDTNVTMKQFHLKAFTLFLLLLPLYVARGQSVVTEVQYTMSDTTIVRYWTEGINIVYTHNSSNDNYFLLVDASVAQVRRIAVPSYVTVNDFRILHDSVFLCGHVGSSSSQQGLLACFAIQDFYNGSGNAHYGVAQWNPMPDCGIDPAFGGCYCQNLIYDITRMAVYDSIGCTKIAYIAKSHVDFVTDSRVGIGSVRYHGGIWDSWFIYNKYAEEEYTDIIATQNYVVAVGRTNDSARLALRIFPKSNFLVPTWTPYPGAPGAWAYYADKFGQRMSDLEVDENVMATALDDDEFAVAYHYINAPGEGLAVKTFNITGTLASLTQGLNVPFVRQPGSVWKMRDIRYIPLHKWLAVLNDIDCVASGSQASIVYLLQPSLPSGTYWGKYLLGYDLHSLDPYGQSANSFVASGNKTGGDYLTLFGEAVGSGVSCGQSDMIMGNSSSPLPFKWYMETNMNQQYIPDLFISFVVDEIERDEICNQ